MPSIDLFGLVWFVRRVSGLKRDKAGELTLEVNKSDAVFITCANGNIDDCYLCFHLHAVNVRGALLNITVPYSACLFLMYFPFHHWLQRQHIL